MSDHEKPLELIEAEAIDYYERHLEAVDRDKEMNDPERDLVVYEGDFETPYKATGEPVAEINPDVRGQAATDVAFTAIQAAQHYHDHKDAYYELAQKEDQERNNVRHTPVTFIASSQDITIRRKPAA